MRALAPWVSGAVLVLVVVWRIAAARGTLLDEYRRKRALAAVNRQHRTSW